MSEEPHLDLHIMDSSRNQRELHGKRVLGIAERLRALLVPVIRSLHESSHVEKRFVVCAGQDSDSDSVCSSATTVVAHASSTVTVNSSYAASTVDSDIVPALVTDSDSSEDESESDSWLHRGRVDTDPDFNSSTEDADSDVSVQTQGVRTSSVQTAVRKSAPRQPRTVVAGRGASGAVRSPAGRRTNDTGVSTRRAAEDTGVSTRRTAECYNCGERGHYSRDCPKARHDGGRQQSGPARGADQGYAAQERREQD